MKIEKAKRNSRLKIAYIGAGCAQCILRSIIVVLSVLRLSIALVIFRVRHGSTHKLDFNLKSVCVVERKQSVIVTIDLDGVLLLRNCVLVRCLRCYMHEGEARYIRRAMQYDKVPTSQMGPTRAYPSTQYKSASSTRSS